jgi:Tol biopolymer transport system component
MLAGTLFAVPFDLGRLEVTPRAVPVVDGVRRGAGQTVAAGIAHFAFSDSGSLVYLPGPSTVQQSDLILFDRKGNTEALKLPPSNYQVPRVSWDGGRIAFETTVGKESAISIYALSGASSPDRLTFGGNNRYPIWSPDGRRLAFQSDRDGAPAVFWQPTAGGNAERLTNPDPGASHTPESWSPDGEWMLFSENKDSTHTLWMLSLRDRKATPFDDVRESSLPPNAAFSPDGRWVAYQTAERGIQGGTFVQPFPPTGTRHQIGPAALHPLWSRDGKELFFIPSPGQLRVVSVSTQPGFTFGRPIAVPRVFGIASPANPRPYDVLPDGRLIGIGVADPAPGGPQIHVVLNWFDELRRLAPAN